MRKLNLNKKEVEEIKNKIYLTDDEEKLLELWLCEKTNLQMSMQLNTSTSTISRLKNKLWNKLEKELKLK